MSCLESVLLQADTPVACPTKTTKHFRKPLSLQPTKSPEHYHFSSSNPHSHFCQYSAHPRYLDPSNPPEVISSCDPLTSKFFNLLSTLTQCQEHTLGSSVSSPLDTHSSDELMDDTMDLDKEAQPADDCEFPSICVPSTDNRQIIHHGQPDFISQMTRFYRRDELKARHQVIRLKRELVEETSDDFWRMLMEGISSIVGAQYAFVAKRILKDDAETAVEMPALGEEGSCLMGLVYFVRDDEGKTSMYRDMQYKGYRCPCAHMRHDKAVVIPDNLGQLFPDNPNAPMMLFPAEAYIATPLFAGSKCYGHIGMMWSRSGLEKRPDLSWAYIELFMRALEDIVSARVLKGSETDVKVKHWNKFNTGVVAKEDVTPQQTIRPAARNLSHELRTPLQGVVGMLDVMQASLDQLDDENSPIIRQFVLDMRKNIENCQDSSQRVVDAADNMVHALDLNMEIAMAHDPSSLPSLPRPLFLESSTSPRPQRLMSEDSSASDRHISKRRRQSTSSPERPKVSNLQNSRSKTPDFLVQPSTRTIARVRGERATSTPPEDTMRDDLSKPGTFLPLPPTGPTPTGTYTIHQEASGRVTLNHKRLNLKEFISSMLQIALKSGGRPENISVRKTKTGEIVTATRITGILVIEWSIEFVPPVLIIDKLTLEKTLYAVLHNAVKFTPHGRVTLTAMIPEDSNFVHFKVNDTGPGIRQQFLPDVFRMWQRADDQLNRRFDGVGLGLFVAKSLAMKLGGDITLVNTSTSGPTTGSEFHIILPIEAVKDLQSARSHSPALVARKAISRDSSQDLSLASSSPLANSVSFFTREALPEPTSTLSSSTPIHWTSSNSNSSYKPRDTPLPRIPPRKSSLSITSSSIHTTKTFDRELGKKIPLRILVAEDNYINRGVLVNMLKRLGFAAEDILEAVDGEHALQVMEQHQYHDKPIDLILMDLWMPRMNGIEATEKIFMLPVYKPKNGQRMGLIVLAVSADASPDAQRDVVRVGMTGFLKKPHTIPALEQLIKEHCGFEVSSGV